MGFTTILPEKNPHEARKICFIDLDYSNGDFPFHFMVVILNY